MRSEPYRFEFKAMGSPCELQLFAADDKRARSAAQAAIAEVERLEAKYSRYREDSLLSEINRAARRRGRVEVDEETRSLLNYASACHDESEGLFDVTSGPLRHVWRFPSGSLPDPSEVERMLARVGWDKLDWDPPVLTFRVPEMELDLGGVVKEYAVDRSVSILREAGVASGMVNLGGDIAIVGARPDALPWRVGVRHPRRRADLASTVELPRGAMASSGDYERCIQVGGRRYGHILNPLTGWPGRKLAAVTVVADFCVVAGSASTIAMLKDAQGPAWLAELGLPHLWVDVDGSIGGSLAAARAA